jgi:hypothetical protein
MRQSLEPGRNDAGFGKEKTAGGPAVSKQVSKKPNELLTNNDRSGQKRRANKMNQPTCPPKKLGPNSKGQWRHYQFNP